MRILEWRMDTGLKEVSENDYRTAFALSLKGADSLTVMRALTFDGVAPAITTRDIEDLFDFIEQKITGRRMTGIGCELGAGAGVFSAILSKRSGVDHIYAVEACRTLLTELMPQVTSAIAGPCAEKITGCVGDFSVLEIADGSVDFIFDFFSLHHSSDIRATLAECRRVLRPRGMLIALDKARPDGITDDDSELMLGKEYGDAHKRQFGIPLSRRITRQDNGEHEYRLKDWLLAFTGAGFSACEHFRLDKPSGGPFILRIMKKAISFLPPRRQPFFSRLLPHGNEFFDLAWENRIFTGTINRFRKEMSLLVAYAD